MLIIKKKSYDYLIVTDSGYREIDFLGENVLVVSSDPQAKIILIFLFFQEIQFFH